MTATRRIERRKGTPRSWVARQMRLPLIIASISCSLVHAEEAQLAPERPFNSKKSGLQLVVEDSGWGRVERESIEVVLYSVADEILSRLPKKLTTPIVVTHTDSNPVALYERGPAGEYRVRLHASGEKWHLYAYEFAHELCHIISNYENNIGDDATRHNQWFEETLCETASLFALKNLASTWETSPPSPKWSEEAKRIRRFFDHLVSEGHRQLPAHTPLVTWLHANEERLRNDPYLRKENEVVANLLLPLFQENPQNWDALSYLNLDASDARNSLNDYLTHWYLNASPEHKRFVASILEMFELQGVRSGALAFVAVNGTLPPVAAQR